MYGFAKQFRFLKPTLQFRLAQFTILLPLPSPCRCQDYRYVTKPSKFSFDVFAYVPRLIQIPLYTKLVLSFSPQSHFRFFSKKFKFYPTNVKMSSVAWLRVDGWVELSGRAICLVCTGPCIQSQYHMYQKMAFLYILCHF